MHVDWWMPNGRASSYRVPILCNQLLPYLLTDILQTLHSCYGHIEDVHVTFWKCSNIFRKKIHMLNLVIFQRFLNRQYLLRVIKSSIFAQLLWYEHIDDVRFWKCSDIFQQFTCNSSLTFRNLSHQHFYLYQMTTVSIIDNSFKATHPFNSWIESFFYNIIYFVWNH
jgi:hypothetical protein